MGGVYVAREVTYVCVFSHYAYAHDFIGCHMKDRYIVGNKLRVYAKEKDGYRCIDEKSKYYGSKNVKIADVNFLEEAKGGRVIGCYNCEKQDECYASSERLKVDDSIRLVGLVDIEDIREYTGENDIAKAIEIVNTLNEKNSEAKDYDDVHKYRQLKLYRNKNFKRDNS